NSIIATHTALGLSDYVVTEAGFGFDLGAEKYLDLVCEYAGFKTSTIVLVATARALKHHGGVKVKKVNEPNLEALKEGLENLGKHLDSIKQYGVNAVVAVNEFPTDTQEELDLIKAYSEEQGFTAHIVQYWAEGGNGGLDLAKKVVELADASDESINRMYDWDEPIEDKILKVAKGVYGAAKIELTSQAKKDIRKIKKNGYGKLPICIAKTQKSLSDKPKLKGRPKGFTITVQEVLIASGAGFVIPITGEIMRMPGLPKRPSALDIDIEDDGTLLGLF
ncbi:MAG: formate--tetrahydrofolate ligase, partial [Candidatus Cloacimonadota bacterium]|nr:formate--tetrahydrofolate ligase [Candidatus Cloacimonadota bacterium]